MLTLSCGHAATAHDGPDGMGWPMTLREWADDGTPAAAHVVYCTACRVDWLQYRSELVLFSDTECAAWLRSSGRLTPIRLDQLLRHNLVKPGVGIA